MSSKRFFYFLLSSIFVLIFVASPLGGSLLIAWSSDPVECFDGCHLEVFVSTYTKDANGDFTPVSQIETGTCFYVNAVVVNTGNVTADDVSATISLGSGMQLAACDSASATKYWDPADPNWQALDPAIPGRVADFWWQVCCTAPGGSQQISVTARAGTGGCIDATGYTYIQTVPEVEKCLYVEIAEIASLLDGLDVCAGCAPYNTFRINVKVTNNASETVTNIVVQVYGNDTSSFTVVGPSSKTIASLAHGSSGTVTFTGRCTHWGEVTLTASAEGQGASQTYTAAPDHVYIHQKEIIAGIESYDSEANPCQTYEIVGAYQNCSGYHLPNMKASITWRGDAELILAGAQQPMWDRQIGEGWLYFTSLNTIVEDLGGGWYRNTQVAIGYKCEELIVKWTFACTGEADVEAYATIEWLEPNYLVCYVDDSEAVYIDQRWNAPLIVDITSPLTGFEICAGCPPKNEFPITVVVTNNTCETVTNITVQMQGNDTSSFQIVGASSQTIDSLTHGNTTTVTFTGRCTAPGEVMLTASAEGQGASQTYT
ncbi:MAG: hypothetical protein FJ004_09960, partial [Chloroflexi bacterium]|nr:hypothetical protein [Chloroflexota bacterium]